MPMDSHSSSLHEGYDEPEILLDQIVKSVPNALTLDMVAKFNIQEISEGDTCKRDYPYGRSHS